MLLVFTWCVSIIKYWVWNWSNLFLLEPSKVVWEYRIERHWHFKSPVCLHYMQYLTHFWFSKHNLHILFAKPSIALSPSSLYVINFLHILIFCTVLNFFRLVLWHVKITICFKLVFLPVSRLSQAGNLKVWFLCCSSNNSISPPQMTSVP